MQNASLRRNVVDPRNAPINRDEPEFILAAVFLSLKHLYRARITRTVKCIARIRFMHFRSI